MRARNWAILGVALVVVAAGGFGVLAWSDRQARRVLDQVIANAAPDWKIAYEKSHYDLFSRRLTLDGVTVRYRDATPATVSRVVLAGLSGSGTEAEPFRAARIDATRMAVGGTEGYAIAQETLTDVSVRAEAMRAPPPDASPGQTVARELTVARVGRVEIVDARGADGASMRRAVAEKLGDGRIGSVVVEGIGRQDTHSAAERVAIADLDVAGLVDAFDPAAYRNRTAPATATTPRVLIGSLEISGIAGEDDRTRTQVARLTLTKFSGRPFVLSPGDVDPADDPKLAADVEQALGLEQMTLEGADVTPKPGNAQGHVTLGRFALEGLHAGTLDRLLVEKLAVIVTGTAEVGLGSMEWGGIELGQLGALMDQGQPAAVRYLAWNKTVHVRDFALAALAVTTANSPPVSVETLKSHTEHADDGMLRVQAALTGLTIPLKGWPEQQTSGVEAFGADRIVADMSGSSSLGGGTLTLDNTTLDLRDLGRLTLAMRLVGYDREAMMASGPSPSAMMAAWGRTKLVAATARYEDASLADRLLRAAAATNGVQPEALRASLLAQLEKMRASLAAQRGGGTALADAVGAVASFLRQPHVIEAKLMPPEPTPIATLLSQTAKLPLTVTTE